MNILTLMLLSLLTACIVAVLGAWQFYHSIQPKYFTQGDVDSWSATRLLDTAILDANLHPILQEEANSVGYTNINGPSLLRVPDWVKTPLAKYYLYFAYHKGEQIRMAYANELTGPWTYYEGAPVLALEGTGTPLKRNTKTTLSILLDYMGCPEAIALWQIGRTTRKVYKDKLNQDIKTSVPTTPHVASLDIVVDHERIWYSEDAIR